MNNFLQRNNKDKNVSFQTEDDRSKKSVFKEYISHEEL